MAARMLTFTARGQFLLFDHGKYIIFYIDVR
jgi:hypothetical protein